MTIGQRIAAKRKELGISQIALGEQMGVSRQSISKWEADAAIPEIDKLIALSKLYQVSVGWLLGVEEPPECPGGEVMPDREFTGREKQIIEALTQSKPAAPAWQKYAILGTAVVAVLSLVLSAVSLYRSARLGEDLRTVSQGLSRIVSAGEAGSPGLSELEDYAFSVTPWGTLDGADFTFTATPKHYSPDCAAELQILLEGEEYLRTACGWNGSSYTAQFSLPADAGYEPSFLLTTQDGQEFSTRVFDPVVQNLREGLSFGETRVTCESAALHDGTLTLNNIEFQISLPQAFRDTPDPWSKCDLVVSVDGVEADRVDILNRSPYSKQVNFSKGDVAFTTQRQSFQLGSPKEGSEIVLTLECELTTGLTMQHTVSTWTLERTNLVGR